MHRIIRLTLALLLWASAFIVHAAPAYYLMLSSRDDSVVGGDIFLTNPYNTFTDFINSPAVVGGKLSGVDIGSTYRASALVYDGKYRLMLSSRDDRLGGNDVFIVTYDTLDDFINSPPAVGGSFSGVDIGSGFVASGLAYDGKYRLMLSSRNDSLASNDIFIVTYDTFADLINSPAAMGGSFSGVDVGSPYVGCGLTYDGKYRLMLCSRNDNLGSTDIFTVTYDTFADLINSPAAVGGSFSGVDVGSLYIGAGLLYVPDPVAPPPPPSDVPEPGTLALMAVAALGLALSRRRLDIARVSR